MSSSSVSLYSSGDDSSADYFSSHPRDMKVAKIEVVTEVQDEEDSFSESCSNGTSSLMDMTENQAPMKAVKFDREQLHLRCQWEKCEYETRFLQDFTEHVVSHVNPIRFEMLQMQDKSYKLVTACHWGNCPFRVECPKDFHRHLYLHVYHSKLKSLGHNCIQRMGLIVLCEGKSSLSNIIPAHVTDFRCAWEDCSSTFVNVQEYYDHVRYHCLDNPRGKNVPGGINCKWKGCRGCYPNITKLRDHMKSHTQEKLNACPICGSLFATRTRLIDHCHRQQKQSESVFSCDLCLKVFASPRLLRDHIRSHVNNYRCSQCDMSCISPSALRSHIIYRHCQLTLNSCQLCTYSAKSKSDLTRHVRNVHEKKINHCTYPGCEFYSKKVHTLEAHELKKHRDPHHSVSKPTYRCHLCAKQYARGNSLTQHLIRVHNLQWPSGHVRFRYRIQPDGNYALLTVRYESEVVITVKGEANRGNQEHPEEIIVK